MTDPRIDVAETVYRFAYGIDQRDWDGYRSVFVAPPNDIEFDYSSYHGRPASRMDAEAWVAGVRPLFDGLDATQHTMTNPLVEIHGRTARCRVYMQATHFLWRDDLAETTGSDNPEFTIGGFYDDRLVRTDEADGARFWRIERVELTVWWRRGNEAIMELARSKGAIT